MAQQTINLGSAPNDGTGDSLRVGGDKINDNFTELYSGKQDLDADLTALAALSGTNTLYYRSAANTWTAVTIGTGISFSGGTLKASVQSRTITSGSVTLDTDDEVVIVSATGGNVTLTLPAANAYGSQQTRPIIIRRTDATTNTVTVQRAGSDTVDGVTSVDVPNDYALRLVSNASNAWYSI